VFVGTMWPLLAEMFFDRKLSVGPPFFDSAFTPFMVLLGLALPVGSSMPWKRASLARAIYPLRYAFIAAVAVGGLAWSMQTGRSLIGPVGMFLGAWVLMGVVVDLAQRTGRGANRLQRLFRLPGADWGKATAHAGLGVTMMGIAGIYAWTVEDIRVAQIGVPFEVFGYEMTLRSVTDGNGPNYVATTALIDVSKDGKSLGTLAPEKRFYPVAQMPTTEAAIHQNLKRDLYLVIGDQQENGGWAVRTYIKSMTNWIWIGCALMALGGMFSLFDRRFRVAVGARKQRKPVAVE